MGLNLINDFDRKELDENSKRNLIALYSKKQENDIDSDTIEAIINMADKVEFCKNREFDASHSMKINPTSNSNLIELRTNGVLVDNDGYMNYDCRNPKWELKKIFCKFDFQQPGCIKKNNPKPFY